MSSADDQYEQQNDTTGGDVPAGDSMDNDYKSRTGQSHIPVQSDDAPVADPIDPATADSDETLGTLPPPSPLGYLHALFDAFSRDFANEAQPRMTVMQLIRAILSAGAHEVQGPVEGTKSRVMSTLFPCDIFLLHASTWTMSHVLRADRHFFPMCVPGVPETDHLPQLSIARRAFFRLNLS